MRILHTSDWHLGQTFYEFDRVYEHERFLKWLVTTLQAEKVDVLLMSGDVFDVSNPSAQSVTLFYTFLKEAVYINPNLQIIIIAGNHDSPTRLEAPKPLLDIFNINIIGIVPKKEDYSIDYTQLVVPIKNETGAVVAWCLAVPFLRNGDYPIVPDAQAPYKEGIEAFYKNILEYAMSIKQPGQALIALGHLHTNGAEVSDQDKSERIIMGGAELVPATLFHNIAYTALGHIHKPQKIGGKDYIRYSGSPIPMSFSEMNYKHQVVLVDFEGENVTAIIPLHIPVSIHLLRIPQTPEALNEVLKKLTDLPESEIIDKSLAPYLEVRVLLEGPEPALRHKIETVIENKYVRLARIDVKYPLMNEAEKTSLSIDQLNELQPIDILQKIHNAKYNSQANPEIIQFFNEVVQEVNLTEK